MSDEQTCLDGNALAGLLTEVLGVELTDAPRGCGSCGAVNAIGAHRLYRGAGWVLRCPVCGDLALCIVELPDRYRLAVTGSWTLELPRASSGR